MLTRAAFSTRPTASSLTEAWQQEFRAGTSWVNSDDTPRMSYESSAERLRTIVRSKLLLHSDIQHRPERFFWAHRELGAATPRAGPGFWIRFTVHYNLCCGSVMALGSPEQQALLSSWHDGGQLGCFALTEKAAGVNSGLVVETTADYDKQRHSFVFNTPSEGAQKNWISQGFVADRSVVVADLRIDGKSYGPHAFLMDMRNEHGQLLPGITVGDMGPKTIGNDLDNAWIAYDSVRLPADRLLSRYADVTTDGQYVQKVKGLPAFHMIGQRLFTGRVAVAQTALLFRRRVFDQTRAYAERKQCWSPRGTHPLAQLPQLRELFDEERRSYEALQRFVGGCEERLGSALRGDTGPAVELVEAIAAAKVRCVEDSISLTHRLKNEVGSYALMFDAPFAQQDFLQCCKFAEGDSRILMLKMARDRLRVFAKSPAGQATAIDPAWDEVTKLSFQLRQTMDTVARSLPPDQEHVVWDRCWRDVYALAEATIAATIRKFNL